MTIVSKRKSTDKGQAMRGKVPKVEDIKEVLWNREVLWKKEALLRKGSKFEESMSKVDVDVNVNVLELKKY
jgi:hypothetical protein